MIIIIGGGLSGLLIAYRLKALGISYQIIEARDRVGGRILTQTTTNGTPLEMGATWFTNEHPQLLALVEELGLSAFRQYNGDFYQYYDPQSGNNLKYPLPPQAPSYRLAGGTSQLINKLADQLHRSAIALNQTVKEVIVHDDHVKVHTNDGQTYQGDQFVLALPPKLWSYQIDFSPSLPTSLLEVAQSTQTWMEDATKAAVEYAEPFWRKGNQASMLVSNLGPFVECYDHTNRSETKFALCGFLNPAYNGLSQEQRKEGVMKQLFDVFGEASQSYLSYNECLWANDPLTQRPSDPPLFAHQNNGHPIFQESYFEDKVLFAGSETAAQHPGYMEGALDAARAVLERIRNSG